MTHLCLCAHERSDHRVGAGLERCTHRACGCDEYRLDPRSPVRDERSEGESATGDAA